MLVARDEKGQLVRLLDGLPVLQNFTCPGCGAPVRLRKGEIVRPHFAHIRLEACRYFSENESAEHLELKGLLYRWAVRTAAADLEHCLPAIAQTADLLIEKRLALEVQCSPLPVRRLAERTAAYQQQGIWVIWLLGRKLWVKQRLSALQRQFLYFSQNMGFHLWELDAERRELRLKYLIHEDLHGRVQHLTKVFPMGEGDLLSCLRLPFAGQQLHSFKGKLEQDIQTFLARQLYYKVPKWLERQAACYQRGENLLTQPAEAFYPQIQPVKGPPFCQIRQDLTAYYQQFAAYYKNLSDKQVQILYPPAFYDKIKQQGRKINGKTTSGH